MTNYLLDTGIIIDFYKGREGARRYWEAIRDGKARGAFSTITEAELWQGLRGPEEEQKHEVLLSFLERIVVDMHIARRAGNLCRQFHSLAIPDALIAASAELIGATLVSKNVIDFEPLQGVIPCEFY